MHNLLERHSPNGPPNGPPPKKLGGGPKGMPPMPPIPPLHTVRETIGQFIALQNSKSNQLNVMSILVTPPGLKSTHKPETFSLYPSTDRVARDQAI